MLDEDENVDKEENSVTLASTSASPILPIVDILLRHAKVNAIADSYDIPRLRTLAITKIEKILKTTSSTDAFLEVVRETLTSNNDWALHDMVASIAAAHVEELAEEKLDHLNDRTHFPAFSLNLMKNKVAAHKAKEEEHKASEELSAQELATARSRIDCLQLECLLERSFGVDAIARANRIIKNNDECRQVLARTRVCRNVRCEFDFLCNIEKGGQENKPRYILRCARCKCRHRPTD